jgi:hypothetical protein
MKKLVLSLIVFFACVTAVTFNSCSDDDGYSLGNFSVDIASVVPLDKEGGSFYLRMDDGTTLMPVNTGLHFEPKDMQRAWVNFTLLSDNQSGYDHLVKINAIQEVLTKEVIDLTSENEEEVGDDPAKILNYWIGDDYLNINFGLNIGGEKTHYINLVRNTLSPAERDESDTIALEFRHNANGDPQRYGADSYVAFDLRPFQREDKQPVEFTLKVKGYDGETTEYKITYNYNNEN